VTDDSRKNPDILQRAQSLATLLHAITLTAADAPERTGISLRRTSRLLYKKLSSLSEHRGTGQDLSQSLDESLALASSILTELSSPEIPSGIPEKDRASLIGSCTDLLNALQHAIGAPEWPSILSDQARGTERSKSAAQKVSQSLQGKVILITRPLSQSQDSVKMIERHGGLPVVIPMIEILDPDDWYPVDHSIVNLKGYDGVIFTSQNGVERFLGRIKTINVEALKVLATRRIYAVGEKTRASLENAQIPVTLVPERFSANDLLSALQKEPLAGKRFLFAKGSMVKGEIPTALRASHAVVDEIEVYRTEGASGAFFGALDRALKNREIDALTFFSPSAVQNFTHAIVPENSWESVTACIGPSTTQAAESAGFAKIITPPEATAESLINALVQYFER
jgi:uroporphyrinogen-III synthase